MKVEAYNKVKIEKAEKQLIERILFSLSQNNIPWRKSWEDNNYLMINGLTNSVYQGRNQMILQWTAAMLDFDDPRWITFNQAKDKGFKIKKGSIGTSIIYTSIIDPLTKKSITRDSYIGLTEEEANQLNERAQLLKKSHIVFNGNQVEGMPLLDEKQKIEHIFENKFADELMQTTLKRLNVNIVEGQDAFYNTEGDYIVLPSKNKFKNELAYYGTAFHEISHATGAANRLNRDLSGRFGTLPYAKEELVAELSSAILSVDTGFVLDEETQDQHAAYCQSWYELIKEEGIFYECLKQAQKTRMYIHGVGDYQKLIDKQSEIEKSNKEVSLEVLKSSISIVDYAKEIGLTPIKESKGLFRLNEHDSCKIYPTNTFYRFSNGHGGSIIDFIQEFEDVDLATAINHAKNYYYEYNPKEIPIEKNTEHKKNISEIELPAKVENNFKAIAYLTKRGIHKEIIDKYVERNMLYQDENENCVFVGYFDKNPMYATRRGTRGSFKQDLSSFSEVGVYFDNSSSSLVLTESVIDQMSYQCLDMKASKKSYLSTNGTAKAVGALNFHISKREVDVKEIIIAFDNDSAGEKASNEIIEWLNENHPEIEKYIHTPEHKDFNEDLCKLNQDDYVITSEAYDNDDQQVYGENNELIDYEGDA